MDWGLDDDFPPVAVRDDSRAPDRELVPEGDHSSAVIWSVETSSSRRLPIRPSVRTFAAWAMNKAI